MTPFIMVIFGATGDLAQNKLMPSLFSLFKDKLLPKDFFIVGFSRRDFAIEDFHKYFATEKEDPRWGVFTKHLFYEFCKFFHSAGPRRPDLRADEVINLYIQPVSFLGYMNVKSVIIY